MTQALTLAYSSDTLSQPRREVVPRRAPSSPSSSRFLSDELFVDGPISLIVKKIYRLDAAEHQALSQALMKSVEIRKTLTRG